MDNQDVDLVREIMADQVSMEAARESLHGQWNEVIEQVLPRYPKFGEAANNTPGQKRTDKIYDATPMLALRHFAAAEDSLITPRVQKWHRQTVSIEDLKDSPPVRQYLEQVTNTLFAHQYRWRANFAAQIGESYIRIVRGLGEVFSVPQKYMRTEEEVAEQDAAAMQQQQAAQLLEAAPVAGGAAQDLTAAAINASNARI